MLRILRDCCILLVMAVAAVWALQHPDEVKAWTGFDPGPLARGYAKPAPAAAKEATERRSGFDRTVALAMRPDGHFHAHAQINGRSVAVLVDTGASAVVLTHEDARAIGLLLSSSDYTHRASTANGQARVAPVVLERVSIGDIEVRDVRALVSEPGALSISLLGMSFLQKLRRVDMRSRELVLQE